MLPISRRAAALAPAALAAAFTCAAQAEQVIYARQLALSPDGKQLAFCWAGDIWTVDHDGGAARRLTAHPANESNPLWSPDGKQIAFASDRHGSGCVFVMTAEGGDIRRLTWSDRGETPTGWTPDGAAVLLHARKNGEVDWEPRLYRVPIDGGQQTLVMNCGATNGRYSPDGEWLAFNRGASRWWRTGYRGSANWDVWVRNVESGEFRQLTDFDGTDMYPQWDDRGRGLYFLSDREDTHNVWFQPLDGTARKVTSVKGDRIRDFTVSADGRRLAYTQWDKVYVQSLPNGPAREIEIHASADGPENPIALRTFTGDADEGEPSPDGEETAVVVRGELFVTRGKPESITRRVTEAVARDWQTSWSPDGNALFFVSDREGQEDIYRAVSAEKPAKPLADSLRFRIDRVTDSDRMDRFPVVSPDGDRLAYVRGLGQLIIRDLKSGEERVLVDAWNVPTFRWSPDGKWMAYAVEDAEYNSDVWIVPADGSAAAVNISQHPDNDDNPQWSADGQILAFSSRREGFDSDLYLVFLSPAVNEKSTHEMAAYFEKTAEAVKKRKPLPRAVASGKIALAGGAASEEPETKPSEESEKPEGDLSLEQRLRSLLKEFLAEPKGGKKSDDAGEDKAGDKTEAEKYEWDLKTAYQRIRRVTGIPDDQSAFALSPDGATIAFVSGHEGTPAVFTIQWNGDERKRILSGGAGGLSWSLDGKRLFYLRSGTPGSCTASGGDAKTVSFRAKMAIDRAAEARQKFDDAARTLGARFYHPTLKDLDWPALSARYRDLAVRVRTDDEFIEIFNLLQGELNGSHLGMSGAGGGRGESIGYLGCDFYPDYAGPGLKISAVLRDGPADRNESRLYVGDVILAVNGSAVGPNAGIEQALVDSTDDLVILRVAPGPARAADRAASQPNATTQPDAAPDADEIDVVIRPISYGALNGLRYREWVADNARYVEEQSDGRLAYVHISGMGEPQFYNFERDLYAEAHGKDGLIIDVRNNGGGWTADWVMAVLNVRRHAYTVGRGGKPGYPQDRLIFYAWTKPATMMCNQFSYSNAEIVSHAFKNLGRGPLVGRTTWGAVISTGSYGLIDGSRIRMPFRGWYTLPGNEDMENHGAKPTIEVLETPDDEVQGRRPQLDAAIRATLDQIAAESASAAAPAEPR